MNRAALVVAALVVLARPQPVLAGSSCGTDSGGSSSSSSSSSSSHSSSSSSYSSSSSTSSTSSCSDTTDVVGYRQCTQFGAWAASSKLPTFIFEIGSTLRVAPSLATDLSGDISHAEESFAYRTIDAPEAEFEHQAVTTLRLGGVVGRGVFVALDIEGGPIVRGQPRTEMSGTGMFGSPTLTQNTGVAFNFAAVAGIRQTVGRGRLGVEVAGGVRAAQYSFTSNYHNCETTSLTSSAAPLLEARAGYEHWIHPFISVGGALGASLIDRGSYMGTVHIGFTTRAFSGGR